MTELSGIDRFFFHLNLSRLAPTGMEGRVSSAVFPIFVVVFAVWLVCELVSRVYLSYQSDQGQKGLSERGILSEESLEIDRMCREIMGEEEYQVLSLKIALAKFCDVVRNKENGSITWESEILQKAAEEYLEEAIAIGSQALEKFHGNLSSEEKAELTPKIRAPINFYEKVIKKGVFPIETDLQVFLGSGWKEDLESYRSLTQSSMNVEFSDEEARQAVENEKAPLWQKLTTTPIAYLQLFEQKGSFQCRLKEQMNAYLLQFSASANTSNFLS